MADLPTAQIFVTGNKKRVPQSVDLKTSEMMSELSLVSNREKGVAVILGCSLLQTQNASFPGNKDTHPICSKVNDERYSLSRQLYIVLVGVRWADKQNQCD